MFQLKANGTDVKTEVISGFTTFLTMVYIVVVNPAILSAKRCSIQYCIHGNNHFSSYRYIMDGDFR